MESHNSAAAKSNTPTAPDTDMWAHSLNQARKDSATDQVQSTQNSDEEELKIDDVEGITDTMPGVSDAEASSFQEDDSSTSLDVVDSVLVDVSITTEENGSQSTGTHAELVSHGGGVAAQSGNNDPTILTPLNIWLEELTAEVLSQQQSL
ncbi:unnamed protein product [Zymoseptoria tritici ST99CH_3D7]|uniref:Uncharacterized protein n=1 Tax=Zymoseptoria tritici (strain ST99CH_3D7) TaxID=1276538 RepID=A0A1X7S7V1_ZYMT9|nr:unnamed protein product [Zymoseptoria tritici ST99CH_3D7]